VTHSEADRIIAALRDDARILSAELHDWKVEVRGEFAEMKAELVEVKEEAKKTNGRLRRIELWRHGLEVLAAARSWVKPALIGVATGVVLAVVSFALTRI
jgi:hypothetical protein